VAKARWRQAEAAMPSHDARVGRAAARGPLLQALRIARELEARPLQRAVEHLARRALIALPAAEMAADAAVLAPDGAASSSATGGSLVRHADPASPVPSLGNGHGTDGTGGRPLVAVVSAPIAEAFAAQAVSRPEPAFGLSGREREVLGLIVEGRTNREIGKLGVSGRVEAAMVAVRLDLVPQPTGMPSGRLVPVRAVGT
jgi:hypothetical protein